jgi:hypothetical protein
MIAWPLVNSPPLQAAAWPNANTCNRFQRIYAISPERFLGLNRRTSFARLAATVKQHAAQIQKMSAQLTTGRVRPTGGLEVSKFAAANTANGRQ